VVEHTLISSNKRVNAKESVQKRVLLYKNLILFFSFLDKNYMEKKNEEGITT